MYCSHCGNPMDSAARFCSVCGAATQPAAFYGSAPHPGPLMRPRYPRAIAGVCSGFALHYGWDLTLVRVVAVLCLLFSVGTVTILYLAAWVIIPEAPYALPHPHAGTPGVNV
jgi:phage shock protein C